MNHLAKAILSVTALLILMPLAVLTTPMLPTTTKLVAGFVAGVITVLVTVRKLQKDVEL